MSWACIQNKRSFRNEHTFSILKPNAEPMTIPTTANQPRLYRAYLEMEKKGLSTSGAHTASTGRVTTELGMKRKAMIAMKDQAKVVCTIHRWRVAGRTVAEIHHARMSAATTPSFTPRTRPRCRANQDQVECVSGPTIIISSFSSTSSWEMPRFSLGSGEVDSEELFPGILSLEPTGVRVLAEVIPNVYSVLPVVANGDRYGPKRWGFRDKDRDRDRDREQGTGNRERDKDRDRDREGTSVREG